MKRQKEEEEEEEDITYIGNGAVQRIRKSLALKRNIHYCSSVHIKLLNISVLFHQDLRINCQSIKSSL